MAKNVDLFGWDLLYKLTEPQLNNPQDIVVCLVHWTLIRNGFRCVGVGEDTTHPRPEDETELLPEGWNAGSKYNLRYVHDNKLYLFTVIKNDNTLIINLSRVIDNHVSGMSVDLNSVKENRGPLQRLIPCYETLITNIRTQLIEPMFEVVPNRHAETQTSTCVDLRDRRQEQRQNYDPNPGFIPNPGFPLNPLLSNPLGQPFFNDPLRDLGRSDLDPFGQGGGMLFNPPGFGPRLPGQRSDTGLPRGSVPPGARFDPIRPPGAGGPPRPQQPRHPDHDHLPPPGYDDMFM